MALRTSMYLWNLSAICVLACSRMVRAASLLLRLSMFFLAMSTTSTRRRPEGGEDEKGERGGGQSGGGEVRGGNAGARGAEPQLGRYPAVGHVDAIRRDRRRAADPFEKGGGLKGGGSPDILLVSF